MWRTGVPAEACFTHAVTEPAIKDVDSDGTLEVIVSSTGRPRRLQRDERLRRVAILTTDVRLWPSNSSEPHGRTRTRDSYQRHQGNVAVVHGNGSVAWRVPLNSTRWSRVNVWKAPVVEDLDADGTPEVFLETSRGPYRTRSRWISRMASGWLGEIHRDCPD